MFKIYPGYQSLYTFYIQSISFHIIFYPNFWILNAIFEEFGIFLPPVTSKQNYDGRYRYYMELCNSLFVFWESMGLEPEHLPVFLYGFAPEVINMKTPDISDLPKPRRAWFVGGWYK